MNSRAILAPVAALAALLTVILVAAASGRPALADAPSVDVAPPSAIPEPSLGARALPEPVLAVEILQALRYWTGRPEDVLRPWARAIADVAKEREDAIWLASQASVESRFVDYVLDFRCNARPRPAGVPAGACDNGWAIGPWQMHDLKMLNASPDEQARRAFQWMTARPQAWTTWRAARAQADAWLAER